MSFWGKQATCLLAADELRLPSRQASVATSCFNMAKQAATCHSPVHPPCYKSPKTSSFFSFLYLLVADNLALPSKFIIVIPPLSARSRS
jgi:hypothetical protein